MYPLSNINQFLRLFSPLLIPLILFPDESMSFALKKIPHFIWNKTRQNVHGFSLCSSSTSLFKLSDNLQTDEDYSMDNSDVRLNLKIHPALQPKKYSIPTILVPSSKVHTIISGSSLKPYLANTMPEMAGLHPRLKIVRNLNDETIEYDDNLNFVENDVESKKLVLLHPDILLQIGDDQDVSNFLEKFSKGPNINVTLEYTSFPLQQVLSAVLPKSAHPPPTGFEQVGHILHLNLKDHHKPYGKLIGQILLERFSPRISCVIDKIGEVSGPYRTYPLEVLAGGEEHNQKTTKQRKNNSKRNLKYNPFWVEIQEAGVNIQFDLQNVYWCSRLSGERAYFLKNELRLSESKQNNDGKGGQLQNNLHSNHDSKNHIIIADAFCGAGALCVQAYRHLTSNECKSSPSTTVTIWANDLNANAINYCRDNAKRNGIKNIKNIKKDKHINFDGESGFWLECGDAFDFISELGMTTSSDSSKNSNKATLPHHLIMNFPLDSPSFLGALRWWPSSHMDTETKVHLYTFARADEGYEELDRSIDSKLKDSSSSSNEVVPRSAIDVAIDTVADNLVPEGGAAAKTKFRRQYLNKLGCNVKAREVRDVAPGKVVVYVQFTVTRSLLRTMQGDFIDI